MDLYSAARRLSRPFAFSEANRDEVLPIGAHGLIGDGYTAALVRIDGAIDWLCLPRFDSPAVFAALLDSERGGLTAITPASRPFESLQRYDPDTNVLETLFDVEQQGIVRLTDFMPWTDDARSAIHEVHRRIECREGEVELEAIFDPRFDWGRGPTKLEFCEHGVLARSESGDALAAVLGNGGRWEPRPGGGACARFRLRAGQRCWLVLSWNSQQPEPISAYRPFEHLRATRNAWREWARSIRYDGPWRHHVVRSALVLKALIYARSGAMVAAPTTSLPEWPGAQRNWDYRYAWTRDAALGIHAANRIGCVAEAGAFFHFMRDALDRGDLAILYTVEGGQVPVETSLPHLAGYAGSRPVRIGNGASAQVQLDTAGALVDAAFLYEHTGGSLTLRAWRHLRDVIEKVADRWDKPDNGIWEKRAATRHHVHSKLMSWLALDRGVRLAPLFGGAPNHQKWRRSADQVRDQVLTQGLDSTGSHFVSSYGSDELDASLLQIPIHGFVPAQDPRVLATVDRIRGELGVGPYLYRYRNEDGINDPEGAFVLCGFWLAEVLALVGRLEEAHEVFEAHAEASNHLGLLSEELDPSSRALLGNFPQAFSHLGLINAATRIDLALRLRDEGSQKLPYFIIDKT